MEDATGTSESKNKDVRLFECKQGRKTIRFADENESVDENDRHNRLGTTIQKWVI